MTTTEGTPSSRSQPGAEAIDIAHAPTRSDRILSGDEERRNVARLVRWMAAFIAWPAFSAAFAFFIWDATDHVLHMATLFFVGAVAVAAFALAPQLANRFVTTNH